MKRLGVAAAVVAACAAWVFVSLGSWFQLTQAPAKADAIVVLGGDPSRAIKAARLYTDGWAPEVWVSRTYREAYFAHLDKIGVVLPKEEELVKKAAVAGGVPPSRVRFYGKDLLSTLEEAQALREALGRDDARLLLVTSPTHARRARWIFRTVFKRGDVRVVAAPEPLNERRWWTRKFLAEQVMKEAEASVYLLLGGQTLNHRP